MRLRRTRKTQRELHLTYGDAVEELDRDDLQRVGGDGVEPAAQHRGGHGNAERQPGAEALDHPRLHPPHDSIGDARRGCQQAEDVARGVEVLLGKEDDEIVV